jgi:hypothetical protein
LQDRKVLGEVGLVGVWGWKCVEGFGQLVPTKALSVFYLAERIFKGSDGVAECLEMRVNVEMGLGWVGDMLGVLWGGDAGTRGGGVSQRRAKRTDDIK